MSCRTGRRSQRLSSHQLFLFHGLLLAPWIDTKYRIALAPYILLRGSPHLFIAKQKTPVKVLIVAYSNLYIISYKKDTPLQDVSKRKLHATNLFMPIITWLKIITPFHWWSGWDSIPTSFSVYFGAALFELPAIGFPAKTYEEIDFNALLLTEYFVGKFLVFTRKILFGKRYPCQECKEYRHPKHYSVLPVFW